MKLQAFAAPLALGLVMISFGLAQSAQAYEAGDWVVRAGATYVDPDDSSSVVRLNQDSLGEDSGVSVGGDTQLGLTLGYMFNSHWGVELLASTPFEHDLDAEGEALAGLNINEVGKADQLPPTLSAIYYFDSTRRFKPYLGLGVNYTGFFDEDLSGEVTDALGDASLSLDDSWGLAAQLGADFELTERLHLNFSVRYFDLQTDAEIKLSDGSRINVDVDVDPLVYTLGLGFRF